MLTQSLTHKCKVYSSQNIKKSPYSVMCKSRGDKGAASAWVLQRRKELVNGYWENPRKRTKASTTEEGKNLAVYPDLIQGENKSEQKGKTL